ncbi:hypothetical protein [Pseudomonas sp. BF-R-24]|uniref:hypothetical protein n=1 Tax=Pseudomonas sp. BF-R-24 TaxID=2832386 RepID=UPI000FA4BBAC|nr:hypothetical protein [Pseudomonas sp. BF-R-24]
MLESIAYRSGNKGDGNRGLIYFYDALQAMADWRVRATTQVLENIAYRSELGCDTVVLSIFSKLLAVAGAGQRVTT